MLTPGLCQCGCGQPTSIAPRNSRRYGWIKGQPLRYIRGHNPARLVTRVDRICNYCGKQFSVELHVVKKRNGGKYCSPSCKGRGQFHPSAETRFWARVDRNGPVPLHCPDLGPCWLWRGGTGSHGYGMLRVDGADELTHRFSYMLHHGPIPADMYILHLCDNRRCCNPDHLAWGTPADNTHDAVAKGRMRRGEQTSAAKMTEMQVREIRYRYAHEQTSYQELADAYDISMSNVRDIIKRYTWRHVE